MSAPTRSRTLELFFIDGKPDGMLTAEVFNWTGHVLMTPRTRIGDALKRDQAHYTGVYLLLGEFDGEPMAYIGEADDVSARIRNHDTNKEWWNTAVILTSSSNSLNKAHARYLESRLIEEANAVGRTRLENGTTPSRPILSEPDQANMEVFLENALMVLPAIRVDSFLKSTRPAPEATRDFSPSDETPQFELVSRRYGLHATAELRNGEFVVHAGSLARREWSQASDHSYHRLHEDLIRSGVLAEHGENLRIFTANYAFNSPSAAAAMVNGRPSNGTVDWKLKGQEKTYKQWEAEQLRANSSS